MIIRPSLATDAAKLAPRLRKADVDEVLAAGSSSPEEALLSGHYLSTFCLTVEEDGLPQLMTGVVPSEVPGTGHPWLLSSDIIDRNPRLFLRESKGYLEAFHTVFPTLTNCVWAGNTKHVRWLRWMGFSISGTTCPSPDGHPFYHFTRTQHV